MKMETPIVSFHIPAYLVRPGDTIKTDRGITTVTKVEKGPQHRCEMGRCTCHMVDQCRIHTRDHLEPILRHRDVPVPIVDVA